MRRNGGFVRKNPAPARREGVEAREHACPVYGISLSSDSIDGHPTFSKCGRIIPVLRPPPDCLRHSQVPPVPDSPKLPWTGARLGPRQLLRPLAALGYAEGSREASPPTRERCPPLFLQPPYVALRDAPTLGGSTAARKRTHFMNPSKPICPAGSMSSARHWLWRPPSRP